MSTEDYLIDQIRELEKEIKDLESEVESLKYDIEYEYTHNDDIREAAQDQYGLVDPDWIDPSDYGWADAEDYEEVTDKLSDIQHGLSDLEDLVRELESCACEDCIHEVIYALEKSVLTHF